MFIGPEANPQYKLRSEERDSGRASPFMLIPLLRTEQRNPGSSIYKHVTPNGVRCGQESILTLVNSFRVPRFFY
jgi:hypothetical protein